MHSLSRHSGESRNPDVSLLQGEKRFWIAGHVRNDAFTIFYAPQGATPVRALFFKMTLFQCASVIPAQAGIQM
jgi:hypothetical protein